jgi:hypothetical protein
MKKNKKHILIPLFLLLNLLISANLSYAFTAAASGSVTIGNCNTSCLALSTPPQLSIDGLATRFISNQSKDIYFYSHYDIIEGRVRITNAYDKKGFILSATSTPSINTSHGVSRIPYSQIGIASFNDGTSFPEGSVDSSRISTTESVESSIDPVVMGKCSEPFDQTTLQNHITNNDDIHDYYTYFPGSGIDVSNSIPIMNTPNNENSMGDFNFGLSAIVRILPNSIDSATTRLTDGTYDSTLTFTLTTKP